MTAARRPRVSYLVALAVAWLLGAPYAAAAQVAGSPVEAGLQAMRAAAGHPVSAAMSPVTGLVRFMSASPRAPVPVAVPPSDPAEARAAAFLAVHGRAFGATGPGWARVQSVGRPDHLGMERVRYRQLHAGIPVTAGEVSVHLRGAAVVAVHARTLVVKDRIDPTPSLTAEEGRAQAQALMDKHYPGRAATYTEARLEVFNRGFLEGRQTPTRLAWFVEARGERFWQYIWIDAHTGARLLDFSQLPHALSRQVFDGGNGPVRPGDLVRSEGGPPVPPSHPAATDANLAYDLAGDTYDYYLTQHGRDSIDGHGMPIISTVRHCEPVCPYDNAFWDGAQMVYGPGFVVDDVVAHELTHGVTQFSANLFYYMQSGALNESFSDIFGETVDLLNGRGNDSPAVRWLIGEDLSIGAFRNMMDPTQFDDPGKVSDPQFVCASPGGDSGGVHANSGVPNHAYALMVDGGAYNGVAVNGIGLVKAGKIQYRALTTYLLSGSDLIDDYHALKQACADLTGAVVTAADCGEVAKALDAVEMGNALRCTPNRAVTVPYCPADQVPTTLFFDDLENPGSGRWVIQNLSSLPAPNGQIHWFYPGAANPFGFDATFATSGVTNFWGNGTDPSITDTSAFIGDSAIAMSGDVPLPAGASMQFNHSYGFENPSFDGGVVEYSTDGGQSWNDAGGFIVTGAGYGGILSTGFKNPLGGRAAFVGDSFGYTSSQLNLGSLAGQNVRFRFRIGTDESLGDVGWFIDDIRIYACTAAVPMVAAILPASRSVQVGRTATAFAAVINAGTAVAENVSIAPATQVPAAFTYQTTDSGNAVTGAPNTPVSIAPGAVQNFVIAFTPTAPFSPINVQFNVAGRNTLAVAPLPSVNTLLLSATSTPGPDVIAVAATAGPSLIVDLPGPTGFGAFAVATANVGAAGTIAVTVGAGSLPLAVSVCPTDAASACVAPAGPSVTVAVGAGQTPTFSFFVAAVGPIPFDPAVNRIFATFTDAATGIVVGATSVAVRTQ